MVDVRWSTRPALPAFIFGSILVSLLAASVCQGAVVRSVHSRSSAGVTEIQVDCDAEGLVHGRSEMQRDGSRFFVELASATLGIDADRSLAVHDSRISGVAVVADKASGSVRLLFDLAKKVDATVQTLEHPSRVRIRFSDAAVGNADVPSGASAQKSGKMQAAPVLRSTVLARRLILLDPGHGGKDPGAQAWHGEWEKEIVLDLARRVADRLRRRLGVDVLMTRNEDTFVSLADRRAMAARWGADVFVSIHANASANLMASGIETYYHCGPSAERRRGVDPATRRLARAENGPHARVRGAGARAARAPAGALPLPVQEDSKRLATDIQRELVRNLGMRYEAVRDLGVKNGPFFVLEDIQVPSVLVEAAFLTHRAEGLRMHSSVYREQVAESIFRGIQSYLAGEARPGTL